MLLQRLKLLYISIANTLTVAILCSMVSAILQPVWCIPNFRRSYVKIYVFYCAYYGKRKLNNISNIVHIG